MITRHKTATVEKQGGVRKSLHRETRASLLHSPLEYCLSVRRLLANEKTVCLRAFTLFGLVCD